MRRYGYKRSQAACWRTGPLVVFCPVLVKDAFHADVSSFGMAVGAFGIGGLLGAIGLLTVNPKRDRGATRRGPWNMRATSPGCSCSKDSGLWRNLRKRCPPIQNIRSRSNADAPKRNMKLPFCKKHDPNATCLSGRRLAKSPGGFSLTCHQKRHAN